MTSIPIRMLFQSRSRPALQLLRLTSGSQSSLVAEVLSLRKQLAFLIHDRDSIFSEHVDETIENLGVRILRSKEERSRSWGPGCPVLILWPCLARCYALPGMRQRLANPGCEPLRRLQCDLRHIQKVMHVLKYSSLGPGIPEGKRTCFTPVNLSRHHLPQGTRVTAKTILGDLHHEYRLERLAA
jgi:putative transposase